MQRCLVLISVKYFTRRFLPEICTALEAVLLKLHAKLAPGRALIQVNFDPIQEIGQKVGGGCSFVSGPFFARLRYYLALIFRAIRHMFTYTISAYAY